MWVLLSATQWWLEVALDGVVGAVIGALVAVGVVLLSFRLQAGQSLEAETVRECRRLVGVTRELLTLVQDPEQDRWQRVLAVMPWEQDLEHLAAARAEAEPCFGALLSMAAKAGAFHVVTPEIVTQEDGTQVAIPNSQETFACLQNVVYLLAKRASDRRFYARMTRERCDDLVELTRAGQFLPKE